MRFCLWGHMPGFLRRACGSETKNCMKSCRAQGMPYLFTKVRRGEGAPHGGEGKLSSRRENSTAGEAAVFLLAEDRERKQHMQAGPNSCKARLRHNLRTRHSRRTHCIPHHIRSHIGRMRTRKYWKSIPPPAGTRRPKIPTRSQQGSGVARQSEIKTHPDPMLLSSKRLIAKPFRRRGGLSVRRFFI
jgi:hypothetical protein